jgi:hypothetical protein
MSYVIRQGRRIEVVTPDTGYVVKPKRVVERYAQITETGARGFEALGCSRALVWFEILYLVWKKRATTIELPNQKLTAAGVSRWAKYRAIRRLEQAGWISVSRPSRKTLQITLLKPECVRFNHK